MQIVQYRIPSARFGHREGLILQIDDGIGEIAPLPGWSRETLQEAKDELLAVLAHKKEPTLPSVRFGLFCALRPFSFAPLSVPLCALHTPRPGCSTLKLKVGHLSIEDAIALVKKYVGKYHLRIDCNRAWTFSQACAFAKHFKPTDFEYLEEPVHPFSDLVRFSLQTQFPIAVDESLRDSPYLEIPTLKAAVVKPTLLGGVPKLPVPIVLSSAYESSIGILLIARLVAEGDGNLHQVVEPERKADQKNLGANSHENFCYGPLATGSQAQGLDTFTTDLLDPPLRVTHGSLTWDPHISKQNLQPR